MTSRDGEADLLLFHFDEMIDHLEADEQTPLLQPTPIPPLLPFPKDSLKRNKSSSPASSPKPSARSTSTSSAPRLPQDVHLPLSQVVQILASLKAGHLPSTEQSLDFIDYALESEWLKQESHGTVWEPTYGQGRLGVGRLSEKGEKVRESTREWLESTRELVRERNPVIDASGGNKGKGKQRAGNGWQEFFWRWKLSQVEIDPPRIPSKNLSQSTSQQSPISSSIFTLITLFFTSVEIRQLLIDLIVLLRDVAQVNLAAEVREDRVPEEVGDGIEKVVDFVAQEGVGRLALNEEQEEENIEKVGGGGGLPGGEAPDPPLVDDAKVELDQDAPTVKLDSTEVAVNAEPVIPDQSAEEIRDTFIDRFKDLLARLQATPEYQSAMRTLLDLARSYLKDSLSALEPSVSIKPTSSAPSEVPVESPLKLLIPLLEAFTGGHDSLSPLVTAFESTLSHFASSNPESTSHALLELAQTFDDFISSSLLTPHYLASSQAHRTINALYDDFSKLREDQPRFFHDLQRFLREVLAVIERISQDPYLGRFLSSTVDAAGAIENYGEVAGAKAIESASGAGIGAFWGDIVEWIVPRILGMVKEIAIPRIEFSSPQVSGALEFPSLLSTSFVPAEFTIKNATFLTYLPTLGQSHQDLPISHSSFSSHTTRRESKSFFERTSYASKTSLDVKGMEFEILDVGYFVKLNTGIPCCFSTITESGLLDLRFGTTSEGEGGGGGFEFSLDTTSLESQVERDHRLFTMLPSSQVSLQHFDIRLHESQHPWLAWFLRPLLKTTVRKAIEVEMRKVVIEQGDRLGEWAYRVKEKKRLVEEEAEARGNRRQKDEAGGRVWNWIKAVWWTITEEEDGSEEEVEGAEGEENRQTGTTLHLNRHGLAVDLPHSVDEDQDGKGAMVGIGTEGVVIPKGEASIPVPPGEERIGIVEEVNEAVESGRTALRNTWDVAGNIGEASEEWREDVDQEREKYEKQGWRSDAFDLQRTKR
ncbi:uncharacterized protein JCM6883_001326 [Sporobolomyces salmoneus]|uniref:uncharacterized protein n=1 Tax=Sporobolomyces salmoneus TaxID=183962 RepID=UPI003179B8C8